MCLACDLERMGQKAGKHCHTYKPDCQKKQQFNKANWSKICSNCKNELKAKSSSYCPKCRDAYSAKRRRQIKQHLKDRSFKSPLNDTIEAKLLKHKQDLINRQLSFADRINDLTEDELLRHKWTNYKYKDLVRENPKLRYKSEIERLQIDMADYDNRKYNKKK